MKHCLHLFAQRRQKILLPGATPLLKSCLLLLFAFLFTLAGKAQTTTTVTGTVTDSTGKPLQGVTVTANSSKKKTVTNETGAFSIKVAAADTKLSFSYIGMRPFEQQLNGSSAYTIAMITENAGLSDVIVVGYGTQKKTAVTGAIVSVTSKDIERVHSGATVSSTLAGKLPGVTFRMADGRPGAAANIQIRNMGAALYVIDGIQQDASQFNNISPNDIENISVLKDAAAAIYGVRAGNGVVVVTTKKGAVGRNNINVDAYAGFQQWFRFPNVVNNSYDYMRYLAEAQVNSNGSTSITQEELDKYKQGASAGKQYRSFDWRKYVMSNNNAPQNSINISINGGSDKVSYYVSGSNFHQNSVLGKEYKFDRSNIQSNVTAKLATGLRAGMDINGRIESYENPGVPGLDDYFLARFAVLRNTPLERPYANDNPAYLNNTGHPESNYAFLNESLSGRYRSDKRVINPIFHVDLDIPHVKGLTLRGVYSYFYSDYLLNNTEYTYKAYTYNEADSTYNVTGGSTNPWREREQIKQINTNAQLQLNYNNTFGKHTVGATVVAERIRSTYTRNWIHASPVSNNLPLIYFPTADQYQDSQTEETRIGYIGRLTYNYANTYFIDGTIRRDASYLFAPGHRVGYFPGVSAGWRMTEEPWFKSLLHNRIDIITDIKLRASYGLTGDDRSLTDATQPIVTPYSYLPGYNYNVGTAIIDGNSVTVAADKGLPSTGITWLKSRMTDVGMDFSLLKGHLNGTVDYFYRKRTGLPGVKNDVQLPLEAGYSLPSESLGSDARYGAEFSLNYNGHINKVNFNVGGNFSIVRSKFLHSYNPIFFNSLDQYYSSQENRLNNYAMGYTVTGQFTSQDQINNYKINIDGKGNKTLLPGDLIYADLNGDGKINYQDTRPIGYGYGAQPEMNFGFTIGAAYKGFDFHADFSGAAGYSWYQNWEMRWAFQNNGNLNSIFEDRWHRANPLDPNSAWIPGKYPPNRVNPGTSHSDYSLDGNNPVTNTFWTHNVTSLRARTIEIGYTIPSAITKKAGIQRARFYVNGYNLFSFDNLKQYGIDPEVIDDNGLQFPQSRVINFGVNLTF
ncbi:SusC/RagA family TonB-linked outer membrane protein [Deminuibacter soli]|uniref:TonB-dependent receptor n=1 Tax=Deminuibacter soli TaxID=2291815 RepID=A0A3E1NKX4_9BACT|nr:TonB-dependent receptor [Deminuibacter soli]RFM28494.1 TonB-dependent receptor [Deminuibacter soli]